MADLSTIGILFGWAVETTAGTQPTTFTQIPRCNKIAGISLTKEKIDVTCLEDTIKKYIGGVSDTGGDWNINFNGSSTFVTKWRALMTASATAKAAGKSTWANVYIPGFGSYMVEFEPGELPMSDIDVSGKLDIQISNTINEYHGLVTPGVVPA